MKFYREGHTFVTPLEDFGTPPYDTEFSVVDNDTFTIAAGEEGKVACLNFASHKRPGGGYKAVIDLPMPIKTQEEDLFRRSDLPKLMDNKEVRQHYPLDGVKGFYCTCLVNRDKKLVPLEKPFECGVITVPAVVNPAPDEPLVEEKILRILDIASSMDVEVLILGAWGCGVFRNDPQKIAELFRKHLTTQFKGVFRKVIFGVPGAESVNHKIFKEVFSDDAGA